jgi:imidazolonepropionase-like amidohydrolase
MGSRKSSLQRTGHDISGTGPMATRPTPLRSGALALGLAFALASCASTGGAPAAGSGSPSGGQPAPASGNRALPPGLDGAANPDPYPSTYQALPRRDMAIVGGTVFTATGQVIDNGVVLVRDGRVEAVGGASTPVPQGYQVVDARGRYVTPGLIDAHSHLGVYPSPGVPALSDGNEATNPNTAQVWAEHSLWPQDPGFNTARAGGVTTLHILPGSANLFGGRGVTVRNVPSVTMQGMKMPGAPYTLKMACGENPSRVYGGRNQSPATGMGNMAGYRRAFIEARNYMRRWDNWRRTGSGDPPGRDLQLETIAGVLSGDILVQNHCYRADEMALMVDLSREFDFRITAFHHASEAYKVADMLREENICSATWTGWWGFKMEALDGIEENVALLHASGACAVVHSDDATLVQRLNQEAAAALSAGRRAGLEISEADAIAWVTINAARMLGIADQTGSLEPGKRADVVIWSHNPFSIYARAEQVYVDGALAYDRNNPAYQPRSDFELGQPGQPRNGGRR